MIQSALRDCYHCIQQTTVDVLQKLYGILGMEHAVLSAQDRSQLAKYQSLRKIDRADTQNITDKIMSVLMVTFESAQSRPHVINNNNKLDSVGISLINTNNHKINDNSTSNRSIEEGTLAGLFLPQILTIMGLTRSSSAKTTATSSGISIEPLGDGVFLSPWQLDNWLRERTVENLAITRVTLQSIVGLLDKVVNMVIRDDVAANIRSATILAKNSLDALKSRSVSNSLQIAFLSSKQALEAAENAFFHPSLLELLYFQDDQKIGIYIPLFVPMIIPVVLAALKSKPYLLALIKTKTD